MESHKESILITGCSTGIGASAAKTLHELGWKVFATARKRDDLDKLTELGIESYFMDYTEPESIESVAKAVREATGGQLFAIFNNGAYGQFGAIEDVPTHALRKQFEANLFGWHDLTCKFLSDMRKNRRGRIIQNSSVLGLVALKYRGAYTASKFALEGLSDTLRLELRGTGVFVSVIQPGPIATNFDRNSIKAFKEHIDMENSIHKLDYEKRIEQRKMGRPSRFRLPPEAVVYKLLQALKSNRPKPNYYVTTPTYLMSLARRLLTRRLLDKFLAKISDS